MAERLSPDVYIEEVRPSLTPVVAVSTSALGIVGFTQRGKTNKAIRVGSMSEFERIFGGFTTKSELPTTLLAFFQNGGVFAYVVRVVPNDARFSYTAIVGAVKRTTTEIYTWTKGSNVITTTGESSLAVGDWIMKTGETGAGIYKVVAISDNKQNVTLHANFTGNNGDTTADVMSVYWEFSSSSEGEWGSGLQIVIEGNPDYMEDTTYLKHNVKVFLDYELIEVFEAVDFNPTHSDNSDYVVKVLNDEITGSNYISIKEGVDLPPDSGFPAGTTFPLTISFTGGFDGTSPYVTTANATSSSLEPSKKGIYALIEPNEMMMVIVPDLAGNKDALLDLITFAEKQKDKFIIACTPPNITPDDAVTWVRTQVGTYSKYCAIYYPWVKIKDPLTQKVRLFNPLGHIAGVYARTDNTRNVGKAPAGVIDGQLSFVISVERRLDKEERDKLYQAKINIIREDQFVGRAVWGARTLSKDVNWQYINVVRLFQFVEKSLFNATYINVFENNGPALWTSIRLSFESFLRTKFYEGYFAGRTPQEAFFVICDETNNTQQDIDQGILYVDVGIAPNKPAEFIVLRFRIKLPTA
jgi:phage tail sheath protein FI